MIGRTGNFVAVITAAAVLLVSATCTSAGCLLRSTVVSESHHNAAAPLDSCCANHPGNPTPNHPADHRCPLCQHTTMLGKAVDLPQYHVSMTAMPIAFCTVVAAVTAYTSFHFIATHANPRPYPPPTLLALCCAFLN